MSDQNPATGEVVKKKPCQTGSRKPNNLHLKLRNKSSAVLENYSSVYANTELATALNIYNTFTMLTKS